MNKKLCYFFFSLSCIFAGASLALAATVSDDFARADTGFNAVDGGLIGPGWEILDGTFRLLNGDLRAGENSSVILRSDQTTKTSGGERFLLEVATYIHGVGRHRRNRIIFNRQDEQNYYELFYWMERRADTAQRLHAIYEGMPPLEGRGVVYIHKVVNGSHSGNILHSCDDVRISDVGSMDGRWLRWSIEATGVPGEFFISAINADERLAFYGTIRDDDRGGVPPFEDGHSALGRLGDASTRWGEFSLSVLETDTPLRSVEPISAQLPVFRSVKLEDSTGVSGTLLYLQDFEGNKLPSGVSGRVALGEGVEGLGLNLLLPDGSYTVPANDLAIGKKGTIEWWVKPRAAARVWHHAYGWWYFLHARPSEPGGFQLDLWRHMDTDFRLTASMGMVPGVQSIQSPKTHIAMSTAHLNPEEWQHLVVSWDLSGERQRVWLLLNGEGEELSLPPGSFNPGAFASLRFGNRSDKWNIPYLPMNGKIDQIRVYGESIADHVIINAHLAHP
jgi:hypothetical protein